MSIAKYKQQIQTLEKELETLKQELKDTEKFRDCYHDHFVLAHNTVLNLRWYHFFKLPIWRMLYLKKLRKIN